MALKEVPSEGLQHHHSEPPPPPASIRVLLLRRHFLAAQSPERRWCPKGEHVEAVLVWVQNALPPAASPSLLHPSLAACCPLTVVPRWRLELGANQRGVKAAGLMQSALLYLCLVGMGTVLSLHKVSAGPVTILAMVAVWMEALSMFSTQRGCAELLGWSRKHLGHQACAGRRCIAVCHGCDVFIRNQGREAFFFPSLGLTS